jgi:hypothetical protein
MLNSGALSTQDRKPRRAGVRKAAMSSRISLLSGVTASSSGSSGSGSTITQESVSRPRARSSKNSVNAKLKRQRAAAAGTSRKDRSPQGKGKGIIDVFEFMEKDQSRASLVQQRARSGAGIDRDVTKYHAHDESDLESDPRSFHSDSGISINDGGSDHDSSKMNITSGGRLDTLQEEHVRMRYNSIRSEQRHHQIRHPIPEDVDEENPEWYYWSSGLRDGACIPVAMEIGAESGHPEELKPSGYDLLASRLCSWQESSEPSLPPIYRRFESLNHRILLQLQDEIAEMEEDLHHMDQADAYERTARHGQASPASRRLDWQWRGSELHARRLELLGRIYIKVEQYSKFLKRGLG